MTDNRIEAVIARSDRSEPASVFRSLADIVYASDDFGQVYAAVCRSAPLLVTGCDHASLMLREGGRLVTAAASDEVAAQVDEFERELEEGPCVDALNDEAVYMDADLLDGSPWPRLAARVLAETPVRGMAGLRLVAENRTVGALNLFSDTTNGLCQKSIEEAILLAAFVSVTLLAAHERQNAVSLRDGLRSNREIGKAVGLMMAFHQIGDAEACGLLRKASQDMNLKLADVARHVVDHHNSRK